ncbi:hypothetical protein AA0522_0080 [Gluconacetobacter liquefaciens NRIC 0522]|nr:hypothetical protein AA0522_0080 [Gluconacetobacter liquefaciens NRIC 0522]
MLQNALTEVETSTVTIMAECSRTHAAEDDIRTAAPLCDAPTYRADILATMPKFMDCLTFSNQALLTIHKQMQREVRYVADMRRWVLTHGALILHFSYQLDPTTPPLTATNLYREVEATGMASPNTVTNFLKEIENLGYIEPLPDRNRRNRAYRMTEFSERMFYIYLDINLGGLDLVDGARRADATRADPKILTHMHPIFARLMMIDHAAPPPPSLAPLINTTIGISILNEMTSGVGSLSNAHDDRIYISMDSGSAMAQRYGTSRANVARLLLKVQSAGNFGKDEKGQWISRTLLHDYHCWQAIKFAHTSTAFAQAQKERSQARHP